MVARRSTRISKPPGQLEDNIVTKPKNGYANPIVNHVDYAHLSHDFQCFVNSGSKIVEPTYYYWEIKDPRRVEAMRAKVVALEQNKTCDLTMLSPRKMSIGCIWV